MSATSTASDDVMSVTSAPALSGAAKLAEYAASKARRQRREKAIEMVLLAAA